MFRSSDFIAGEKARLGTSAFLCEEPPIVRSFFTPELWNHAEKSMEAKKTPTDLRRSAYAVRRRAGNLREPSIQLGDQEFEPAHRLQFRKDRAALFKRPRFESRELSCLEPRTELSNRLSQLIRRMH